MSSFETKRNIAGGSTPGSGMVIGDPVIGGDPGWILYIDQTGNLIGDEGFIRNSSNGNTLISTQSGDGNYLWGVEMSEGSTIPNLNGVSSLSIFDDGVDDIIQINFVGNISGVRQNLSMIYDNISTESSQVLQKIDNINIKVNDFITSSEIETDLLDGAKLETIDLSGSESGRLTVSATQGYLRYVNSGVQQELVNLDSNGSMFTSSNLITEDSVYLELDSLTSEQGIINYYDRGTQNNAYVKVSPTGLITAAKYTTMFADIISDNTQFVGTGPGIIYIDATLYTGALATPVVITTYQIDGTNLVISAASGDFQDGETVTGGTSGQTGIVVRWAGYSPNGMVLRDASGAFTNGETITGGTSGETATVTSTSGTSVDIFESGGVYFFRNGALTPFELANGLTINFPSITGNDLGDMWTWERTNSFTGSFLENSGRTTRIGDASLAATGTLITINDTIETINFETVSGSMMSVEGTRLAVKSGDINDTVLGWKSEISGVENTAYIGFESASVLSSNYLYLDGNSYSATLFGSTVTLGGATSSLIVDDSTTTITLNSVGFINLIGQINSTLSAYADDAAAGTGGLIAGDLYQTDGSGAAPLNVAGIVMVKQ